MNLLRSLSNRQRTSVFIIILLIITSLWTYERYENVIERESYTKIYEENQLLKDEIDNLKEQNQSLHEVLELKRQLE